MGTHDRWILDVVETWLDGYWMIRETGIIDVGRLDALLVPVSQMAHCMRKLRGHFWDRIRLVGIEIKTSRADFQSGLRKCQYDRYNEKVSGLYIATLRGVCKTKEIPQGVGHLVLFKQKERRWRCVCKRHPSYADVEIDADVPWRLLFEYRTQVSEQECEHYAKVRDIRRRIGDIAASRIFAPIRAIDEAVKREFSDDRDEG